jgi:hypothetical protein
VRKRLAAIIVPLALLVLIGAIVVVANQAVQLIDLADRMHPTAGDIAFWSLIALMIFCVGVPAAMLFTMPAALIPPDDAEGPEYERHLRRLQKRLSRTPHVTGKPTNLAEVQTALAQLDDVAERRIRASASQVFMTTAISQNGSLDALLVLTAQSKLVLEIARTYYQRPSIRDLLFLYSNVAATAFIAAELEDIDISEQIQPIFTAVAGSGLSAVPGMGAAASLFVNSVTTGAGNAYLTLRVGIITRQYCRSLVRPERRALRHMAALQAARMLGGIAREGAASVAAAVFARPRKFFTDLLGAAGSRVTAMSDTAVAKSTSAWNVITGRGTNPGDEPATP